LSDGRQRRALGDLRSLRFESYYSRQWLGSYGRMEDPRLDDVGGILQAWVGLGLAAGAVVRLQQDPGLRRLGLGS
jgi:hypothetical protein